MNDAFVKPSPANAHSGLPIVFTCVLYFWLRQYQRMIAAATELFDPQGISNILAEKIANWQVVFGQTKRKNCT